MWHGICLSVTLTGLRQKLNEQNPILWKQYISHFDKDILLFLKQVKSLDPIYSIHFLAFKLRYDSFNDFRYVGEPYHIEVFLDFFLDPSRSGKYHLTPQQHADIAVWMIEYYSPLPRGIFMRQFQSGGCKSNIQRTLAGLRRSRRYADKLKDQPMVMPIDVYLSHASRFAEQLIEIIRYYNADTFPLMTHPEAQVRGIVVQYYS